MATPTRVRVTWDDSAIRRILHEDDVPRAVARAAGRVRDRARVNLTNAGRVNTGALRNSIESRRGASSGLGGIIWFEVGSDLPYAIYQHEGVEGPILPRRAKVLRFQPKGSSTFVFARETAGFEGVPYLTDALAAVTLYDYL